MSPCTTHRQRSDVGRNLWPFFSTFFIIIITIVITITITTIIKNLYGCGRCSGCVETFCWPFLEYAVLLFGDPLKVIKAMIQTLIKWLCCSKGRVKFVCVRNCSDIPPYGTLSVWETPVAFKLRGSRCCSSSPPPPLLSRLPLPAGLHLKKQMQVIRRLLSASQTALRQLAINGLH